ncbi:hypothetical protein [Sulfurospirillum sp. UCH001]|uniref:hypothetical protein n=1 Tax=Sulfurospirillum sp. UCH001 TaxID=1581011 RepID=UPI00082ACB05|nr:hypothetical protein [Sulfurospirillum sp. UCH001]
MFKELENTLKDIKNELILYRELFALSLDSLTTQKQVAKFLGISQKTLCTYIKNGVLIEGIHFIKNKKNEFIPYKIIEFKQQNSSKKFIVNKVDHCINPLVAKFLKQKHG